MRKLSVYFGMLAVFLGVRCWGQVTQSKKLPPECEPKALKHNFLPKGPFKWLPTESYKHSPIVKFEINEDGTVTNVKLVRSSGIADLDKQVINCVASWKYKPRPAGCGIVENKMLLTIDLE